MRKKSSALLAAVAVAAAIAGCGGGGSSGLSAADYGTKLQDTLTPLGAGLQKLSTDASAAQSKGDLQTAIQGGETTVQNAITTLSSVTPPSEASAANDELLSALNDYESSLKATEDAVANGSNTEIQKQVQTFQTDSSTFVSKLGDIRSKLDAAGVPLGSGTTTGTTTSGG
jgi:hypothetical protein